MLAVWLQGKLVGCSAALVKNETSQQLLDGLLLNFVHSQEDYHPCL